MTLSYGSLLFGAILCAMLKKCRELQLPLGISALEDAEERVYLVGKWVFTGSCYLTSALKRLLPSGGLGLAGGGED